MVKQLIDSEVLIAAASFAVSQERQQVVNFTSSIDLQPYSFLYRRPKEISRAGIFIKPFTPFVWLCVTVVILMMGPIIWITTPLQANGMECQTETIRTWLLETQIEVPTRAKSRTRTTTVRGTELTPADNTAAPMV